MLPDKA